MLDKPLPLTSAPLFADEGKVIASRPEPDWAPVDTELSLLHGVYINALFNVFPSETDAHAPW